MKFDDLLKTARTPTPTRLSFPTSWCQGRTAFGGLSSAMLLEAMREQVSEQQRLRSMSVNFVGPLLADEAFDIEIEILREGKNTTQVLGRAIQNGQTCVLSQACFASDRQSGVTASAGHAMTLNKVDPGFIIPHQDGVMPAFIQHLLLSPQQGAMPFSGADTSHLGGWMRFKEAPEQLSESHVLALTDAWPPTMLQKFTAPAPASSMSWYIEFIQMPEMDSESWLGFEAITHHAGQGYALEDGKIWSESGELIALTRQTVALFA